MAWGAWLACCKIPVAWRVVCVNKSSFESTSVTQNGAGQKQKSTNTRARTLNNICIHPHRELNSRRRIRRRRNRSENDSMNVCHISTPARGAINIRVFPRMQFHHPNTNRRRRRRRHRFLLLLSWPPSSSRKRISKAKMCTASQNVPGRQTGRKTGWKRER